MNDSDRDKILVDFAKPIAHFRLDGGYNFDMRQAPDGSVTYLECNPRFFFKINLSLIAGINFVACGLPGAGASGPWRVTCCRIPRPT